MAESAESHVTESQVEPSFTPQEISEAESKICEAHKFVSAAVRNANNPPDPGTDAGLARANIAVALVSLIAASDYLRDHLDPAVPDDLRQTVELLVEKWSRAVIGGVGGGGPTYEQDVAEANVASEEVRNLCQ